MTDARGNGSSDAPHGIGLSDHARLSAEIAEGDRTQAQVLDANGLTEAQWNDATACWMRRMGDDARERGQDATLAVAYSEAFGKAQDALKPLPPTDAASYAALVVAIQGAGGPARPLAARGLSNADYLRLARHWARILPADPAEAQRFFEAYCALQPEGQEA